MQIQDATEADLDALTAIAVAQERYYAQFDDAPTAPDEERLAARIRFCLFEERFARALLASSGGEPVGVAYYSILFPGANFRPALFVKTFFVVSAARSRGVGRALVENLKAKARAADCDRVELHVVHDNSRAIAFYHREGFYEQKDRSAYRFKI